MCSESILISLNGSSYRCPVDLCLKEFLVILKKNPHHCVLEHNGNIVNRDDYDKTFLVSGDCLEVIAFVGGGEI